MFQVWKADIVASLITTHALPVVMPTALQEPIPPDVSSGLELARFQKTTTEGKVAHLHANLVTMKGESLRGLAAIGPPTLFSCLLVCADGENSFPNQSSFRPAVID